MKQKPMLNKCGSKSRTNGMQPCRRYAMENGRCYMHGGKSTGPKTPEGLARIKAAKTQHGFYGAEAIAERKFARSLLKLQEMENSRNTIDFPPVTEKPPPLSIPFAISSTII